MITEPKLIRDENQNAGNHLFYGRRRRIRTADPLGVNVTASKHISYLQPFHGEINHEHIRNIDPNLCRN